MTTQQIEPVTQADITEALRELVKQVRRSNAIDDNGHRLENLKALHDAETVLSRTTPAPSHPMKRAAKLTDEYLAMTPRQKWETLCLNGLIGYGEPWIEDMRQSLKSLEAPSQQPDAKCRYCGGAGCFQVVSPVSDHAWANCFCMKAAQSQHSELADDETCTDCYGTGFNEVMERRCDCNPISADYQLAINLEAIRQCQSKMVENNEAIKAALAALRSPASASPADVEVMRHVAYFDEGEFHWMTGHAPRDCELYTKAAPFTQEPKT